MNRKNRVRLAHAWKAIRHAEHVLVAKVAVYGHLAYYGLVTVEAHGSYRYAAGALAVVVALELLGGKVPPE